MNIPTWATHTKRLQNLIVRLLSCELRFTIFRACVIIDLIPTTKASAFVYN
jgi:hypothetical protein